MKSRFVLLFFVTVAIPGYASQTVLGLDGVQSVQLSPDGEHLALLKRQSDIDELFIVNIAETGLVHQRHLNAPQRIRSIAWVDNVRVVIESGEDVQYEREPQPTGEIEILTLSGESGYFGGSNNGGTAAQQAMAGKQLVVVDSLPVIPRVILVEIATELALWLVDVQSGSIDVIEYPQLEQAVFTISKNMEYIIAAGPDDAGSSRVLGRHRGEDASWIDLDPALEPMSINNAGIVYALRPDESGIKGLVSVDFRSGESRALFLDEKHDVDTVLFDTLSNPFAVRFMPGYPSWHYLRDDHPLTSFHKSLRAAAPQSDVSLISSSIDGTKIISEVRNDNQHDSYFLIDAESGRTQRLLESDSGLWILGGEPDAEYTIVPFSTESQSGSEVFGYVSSLKNTSAARRPTVVALRDNPANSRWEWGFNEEVRFLNRVGFNVLMVNHSGTIGYGISFSNQDFDAALSDIEAAVDWMTQNNLTYRDRICIFGRGTGAEIALLAALRSNVYKCVISVGGTFGVPELVLESASDGDPGNPDLQVLFINGGDDGAKNIAIQEFLQDSLDSMRIASNSMSLPDEKHSFNIDISEVRALAQAAIFLNDNIGSRNSPLPLPLTYQQAIAISNLLIDFEGIAQRRAYTESGARRRWLISRDPEIRESLSEEQWPIYEMFRDSIADRRLRARGHRWPRNRSPTPRN